MSLSKYRVIVKTGGESGKRPADYVSDIAINRYPTRVLNIHESVRETPERFSVTRTLMESTLTTPP
jgi:hypothetical protein